jgi:hypothetical protein
MPWKHGDLTAQTQAPTAGGSLMGYTTSLDGQGSVARVLYWGFEDRNVHELSLSGGGRWKHTDLTTQAHAPIATAWLMGYTTSLGGQGPVARVVFIGHEDQHVHELSLSGGGRWKHTDLTDQAHAPTAFLGPLVGYTTSLDGQGPVARVLYWGYSDAKVRELSLSGGRPWKHADLTAQAHAPTTTGSLMGYTTSLGGQGPVARVVFLGEDQHVHELFTFT